MNYSIIPVSMAPPLRPHCTMCTGLVGLDHFVVRKYPTEEISVLCKDCADVASRSDVLMRAVELATTMGKTLPELRTWMARWGVWEIPLNHEDLARALGVPLGFPQAIWVDPR